MFERFTGGARAAVVVAQDSARFMGHRRIGTEHVLLGLLATPDFVAGRVLAGLGVTREGVIADIERIGQAGHESERDLLEKDTAALLTIGIDLDAVRAAVEESFGPGALEAGTAHAERHQGPWWRRHRNHRPQEPQGSPRGHIPFTPRAKKVLELSLREALALKHNYIGTEHILLGLIREGRTEPQDEARTGPRTGPRTEPRNLATRILRAQGVSLDHLRDLTLAELQRAA